MTSDTPVEDELYGVFRRLGVGCEIELDRSFDISPERLWAMLTNPEELAGMVGGTVHELELAMDGAVKIDIFPEAGAVMTGNVTQFEEGFPNRDDVGRSRVGDGSRAPQQDAVGSARQ